MSKTRKIGRKTKVSQPTITSTVLFKFTEDDHRRINTPFRHSLERLKAGNGDQTDWFNVFFRVLGALLLAECYYEDVTIQELKRVNDICEEIEQRAKEKDHKVWEATPVELEWLEAAFDAMEELQQTVPRKQFHASAVEAEKRLKDKYVTGRYWKSTAKV